MTRQRTAASPSLADQIYARLKQAIFDFELLPGDPLSENDVAARMEASRTPVREALLRLEKDGYLQMKPRAGWQVKPFDFRVFEELYDVRTIIELAAIRLLGSMAVLPIQVLELRRTWLVEPINRLKDGQVVHRQDEDFHAGIVAGANNGELTRIHTEIAERIRIVRRLDFTEASRLTATYIEHRSILEAIMDRQTEEALSLMTAHIGASRAAVRQITMDRLEAARSLRYET